MDLNEYERMQPHVSVDGMVFSTPNSHCKWRVETLYTKEPDTIAWIRGMKAGETFIDVGANIGLYSVFAAKQGLKVYAFEPESQNFAVLCKNIVLNKLTDCLAFPVALAEYFSIDTLRLSSFLAGSSCHSYGSDKNYQGEDKAWPAQQGCIALSLSQFCTQMAIKPDHIKIDVDGLEGEVIVGIGDLILKDVKSILVEINSRLPGHMKIWDGLVKEYGFKTDETQWKEARRKEGPFEGIGNVIFTR